MADVTENDIRLERPAANAAYKTVCLIPFRAVENTNDLLRAHKGIDEKLRVDKYQAIDFAQSFDQISEDALYHDLLAGAVLCAIWSAGRYLEKVCKGAVEIRVLGTIAV